MQRMSLGKADVVALALVALVLALLSSQVLGQAGSRELSNRAVCAANLSGLMKALILYSADNNDAMPLLPPSSATTYDVTFKDDPGDRDPVVTLESLYKDKKYSNNPQCEFVDAVGDGCGGA